MSRIVSRRAFLPPRRMVAICSYLGFYTPYLYPEKAAPGYETTPYLDILKPLKKDFTDFTVFSGLSHPGVVAPDPKPAADLLCYAELLSARRLDDTGALFALSDRERRERLADLTARYPELFRQTRPASQTTGGADLRFVPPLTMQKTHGGRWQERQL